MHKPKGTGCLHIGPLQTSFQPKELQPDTWRGPRPCSGFFFGFWTAKASDPRERERGGFRSARQDKTSGIRTTLTRPGASIWLLAAGTTTRACSLSSWVCVENSCLGWKRRVCNVRNKKLPSWAPGLTPIERSDRGDRTGVERTEAPEPAGPTLLYALKVPQGTEARRKCTQQEFPRPLEG